MFILLVSFLYNGLLFLLVLSQIIAILEQPEHVLGEVPASLLLDWFLKKSLFTFSLSAFLEDGG
jgi:hypothetical protein